MLAGTCPFSSPRSFFLPERRSLPTGCGSDHGERSRAPSLCCFRAVRVHVHWGSLCPLCPSPPLGPCPAGQWLGWAAACVVLGNC